jgi:signal peptidase II
MNSNLTRPLAVGVIAVVVADWLSKFWVASQMAIGEMVVLVEGWLYFVHRKNTGVAFSMFADLPDAWRVPLLVFASLVGVVLFGRILLSTPDRLAQVAAAAVMAGAIGNLGDRVVNGHVTDFVLLSFFPFVFNLADAAITCGGVVLALRLLATEAGAEPAAIAEPERT